MDNVSSGMKSLCEDIATGHEDRKRSIKDLREQAESIRDNARKFVSDCRRLHEEMAKDLRKDLAVNRENLLKNVNALREEFREKEKEIKTDLAEASKIWSKLNETLRSQESKSKTEKR